MDWDELRPPPRKTQATIGDNLETLSIAELEARIGAFEQEIQRIRSELAKKRKHEEAASALFGKPRQSE